MKILSVCGFQPYWGTHLTPDILDLNDGPTVGGGEEAAIRTAAGLHQLGHDVTFYWYGRSGEWRGMKFRSLYDDLYRTLAGGEWDAVLGWSTLRPLEWTPKRADGSYPRRLYCQQLNDLWDQGHWDRVDAIVSPSQNHSEQLPGWGWHARPYAVVHNGLDEWLYGGKPKAEHSPAQQALLKAYGGAAGITGIAPDRVTHETPPDWHSRPRDVGYWSSPDRGLHHLLKVWPDVRARVPDARLHVFYEIDRFLTMATQSPGVLGDRARLIGELVPRAKADKSIIFHGAVPRNRLRKTQFQTRVMAYPYQPFGYCEGFCGSVNQSIAAGCHVMTTPHDALPSLYDGAVTWLPKWPTEMERVLAETIVRGLTDEKWSLEVVRKAEQHRFNFTWERAALEMEKACMGEGWQLTADRRGG